mgnify:CR=1 FL=1
MAVDKDPSTMSSQSLNTIANDEKHPLHTHAKAELARRNTKKEGGFKRIATSQSSKPDRMAPGKGLDTFKKKEIEKTNEKTLTPNELKKRKEVAKAIAKDDPNMPMDKKMAIATATAKRVAEDNSPKNCPDGQYYCQSTLTCKPIPDGHVKNKDGFLVKESVMEAYIDHRSDKIGPSNVGMTHAKAEKAHRDMASKLASSHKRTDLHGGRNSVGDVIKMHKKAADQHAKALRAHNAGKHSQARNHANKASKHGTDIFNAHANAIGDAKKHSSAGIDAVGHSHDAEKRSIASKEAQKNQRESTVYEAYKVGQTVKPTKGPHAGQDHEVIHVHGDGSYNIKPKNMPASRIRYRLGAAKAKHDDLKEVSRDRLSDYMRKSADDVAKARGDTRRQDKRISGQKKADDKIRAMQGKRDASHIKVPATESKEVDELSLSMKDITKTGISPVVTKDKEKIKKDLAAMKPKEATIPDGKTAMTKSDKPDLSADDKIKLDKIMKMIGKR